MPSSPLRVVLDTNVVVRAMINVVSPAGRILLAAQRRHLIPLLSKPVLMEYVATLTHPEMTERFPELQPIKIRIVMERITYIADFLGSTSVRFPFPRDPRDAKFVELAIAGHATHLVTTDRDLLGLQSRHDDAARRFRRRLPAIEVLDPAEFVARHLTE